MSAAATSLNPHPCLARLDRLLSGYHSRDFAIRLWDGTTRNPEADRPARFTWVIKNPDALARMLLPPRDLAMAEAYLYDDFDLEGDLEAACGLGEHLLNLPMKTLWGFGGSWWRLLRQLRQSQGKTGARLNGTRHSIARDHQAVAFHYNVSNHFFGLWLDQRMVYSCAYFRTPYDNLDTAQEYKLDYICRKLRLRPGERLLDIGCGWGALIMHAARHYGVQALGLTLSEPQAEFAGNRIRRGNLSPSCRVELRDYRDLPPGASFDKIVSVGMYEHVGRTALPAYFDQAWRLLRPGGVFLNHGIAQRGNLKRDHFTDRYVFPDGELIPVGALASLAEERGFHLRDVESLREHYTLTLRHWRRRLEACHEDALRFVDETTYRVFRLYLAAFAARFHAGLFDVYQTLLSKPAAGDSGLPLTRQDWYAGSPPSVEALTPR